MPKMPPTAISYIPDDIDRLLIHPECLEEQVIWVRSDGSVNGGPGHWWHELVRRAVAWGVEEVLVTFAD